MPPPKSAKSAGPYLVGFGLDPCKHARTEIAVRLNQGHVRNMRQVSDKGVNLLTSELGPVKID